MIAKTTQVIRRLHPKRVVETFPLFLKDEAISGKLILIATILALIAVNSPLRSSYDLLWHNQLSIGLGNLNLSLDLRHWLNEGLMAIFFLVVGLEIKREIVFGQLKDVRRVLLPIAAALGGMVVPALLYLTINHHSDAAQGWGIPIATDIAFAVTVLLLLGSRIPKSLKLFLLTLAIADDIGAIFVIALFYANSINFWFLTSSVLIALGLWGLRRLLANRLPLFILFSIVLWLTMHATGIHASIVGAIVGLLAPTSEDPLGKSVARRLEDFFLPISTFIVLPMFAFANAGVVLSTRAFSDTTGISVITGVVIGLAVGKMVGIFGASWLMTRFGRTSLPTGTTWRHIIGVGFIAGIGFTVSIFMSDLAFPDSPLLIEAAKIGIFIASILSAILGATLLLTSRHPNEEDSYT